VHSLDDVARVKARDRVVTVVEVGVEEDSRLNVRGLFLGGDVGL
jgi:hypothetical protein